MGKSLFGSKSKSKSQTSPWEEALPYILGDEQRGISGYLPEVGRLYDKGGWNDSMDSANKAYLQYLQETRPSDIGRLRDASLNVMGGMFDTNLNDISPISGVNDISSGNLKPMMVDAVSARQLQGSLNPTGSLQQLLSGQVNNQYLDPMADNIIARITRNTTENIFPQTRSGAIAGGQYGSSREGIAEGLATSRMNQDIASAITPMYASAYENAQNRMQGVASDLNSQAMALAEANAARDYMAKQFNVGTSMDAQKANALNKLNTQQFNANLGLQNNAQRLNANTANLANRLQGLNVFGMSGDLADNSYNNYIQALMQPNTVDWNNLGQYYNIVAPTAQTYGMNRGTQTQTPGLIPSILGTVAGIGGIASGMGAFGGAAKGMTNFAQGLNSFSPLIGNSGQFMNSLFGRG